MNGFLVSSGSDLAADGGRAHGQGRQVVRQAVRLGAYTVFYVTAAINNNQCACSAFSRISACTGESFSSIRGAYVSSEGWRFEGSVKAGGAGLGTQL